MNSTISLQIVQSVTMQLLVLGLWNQKLLPLRTFIFPPWTVRAYSNRLLEKHVWIRQFNSLVCLSTAPNVRQSIQTIDRRQANPKKHTIRRRMGEAFQNQDEEHWKKQRTGTSLLVIVFIVVEHKATKNKNFLSSTIRTQTSDVAARTDPDHNHVSLRAIYHQSGSVFSL